MQLSDKQKEIIGAIRMGQKLYNGRSGFFFVRSDAPTPDEQDVKVLLENGLLKAGRSTPYIYLTPLGKTIEL